MASCGLGRSWPSRLLLLRSTDLPDLFYNVGGTPNPDTAPDNVGAISQILGYTSCGGAPAAPVDSVYTVPETTDSNYVGDPAVLKLHRWLPERHPIYPFLVAKSTKIKYIPSNEVQSNRIYRDWANTNILGSKINSYPLAIVEVEYEAITYLLKTDGQIANERERYVTIDPKPNGDYLSLPTGGMKWTTEYAAKTQLAYPAQNGVIVPTIDYVITWHQIPAPCLPLGVINKLIGRVNNKELALDLKENTSGKTFGGHTLLLTGVELERKIAPYGGWYYDIKYTMKHFRPTHNRFLDFHDGVKAFYHISIDGQERGSAGVPDGKYIFDSRNFEFLFTPEAN